MTRKPVTPPAPKITRPLASIPEPKNPITTEIMQRVRRVIKLREITCKEAAFEIGVGVKILFEWISTFRAKPTGDNYALIIRWLVLHDPRFSAEVLQSPKIRFRGDVLQISSRGRSNGTLALRSTPR